MATFLTPDSTRVESGIIIKRKLLPDGSRLKPNRPLLHGSVDYVTIHNTADIDEAPGTNDAEQYARATHNGAMSGVSVHYYIDETDCWQLLRENEMGYHAADGNTCPGKGTSLAIEIIMDGSGSDDDVEAEERGAVLAAVLLHRHGLGIDKLKTHRDWYPAKYCPFYILPHWAKFRAKVETYLNDLNAPWKSNEELAQEVLAGRWGDGAERRRRLIVAGYDYNAVQSLVKQIKDNMRIMMNDVDGDGKITAADARIVLRAAVGMQLLSGVAFKAADANGDGKITAADARVILRKAVGLEG